MRAIHGLLYVVFLVLVGSMAGFGINNLIHISDATVKPPVVTPVKPPVVTPPITVNQKGEYKVDVKIDINIRYPNVRRFDPCSLLFN